MRVQPCAPNAQFGTLPPLLVLVKGTARRMKAQNSRVDGEPEEST